MIISKKASSWSWRMRSTTKQLLCTEEPMELATRFLSESLLLEMWLMSNKEIECLLIASWSKKWISKLTKACTSLVKSVLKKNNQILNKDLKVTGRTITETIQIHSFCQTPKLWLAKEKLLSVLLVKTLYWLATESRKTFKFRNSTLTWKTNSIKLLSKLENTPFLLL